MIEVNEDEHQVTYYCPASSCEGHEHGLFVNYTAETFWYVTKRSRLYGSLSQLKSMKDMLSRVDLN